MVKRSKGKKNPNDQKVKKSRGQKVSQTARLRLVRACACTDLYEKIKLSPPIL